MSFLKHFAEYTEKNPVYFYGFIIILFVPAFLVNLGMYPFSLDEATRAVVAMEMKFSGNYFTPTINGEYYFNKPPLFNWIILAFSNGFGTVEEWIFRLPVVLSLLGFGISIFLSLRREIGDKVAALTAIAVLTSGRILFYDSFKGLIDISFSWITYLSFIIIYRNYKRDKLYTLFILSYFFTACGYLMKGLPSLVFQGITLLVFFISRKSFRKLFSLSHIAGIAGFILIVGGYYIAVNREIPISKYFTVLLSESMMRTPLENSVFKTLTHFFTFPFEFIYTFLPWTVLILPLLNKNVRKLAWEKDILRFFILVFISNIAVYWISPAIFPRYLFMFLPLFFGLGAFIYYNLEGAEKWKRYFFFPFFGLIVSLTPVFIIALPFYLPGIHFKFLVPIVTGLFILAAFLAVFYFIGKGQRLLIVASSILLLRIGFNLFVFEDRLESGTDQMQKIGAIEAAGLAAGTEIYLYQDCPITHVSTFYIERETQKILSRWNGEMQAGKLYIVTGDQLQNIHNVEIIADFETRINALQLQLVRLK